MDALIPEFVTFCSTFLDLVLGTTPTKWTATHVTTFITSVVLPQIWLPCLRAKISGLGYANNCADLHNKVATNVNKDMTYPKSFRDKVMGVPLLPIFTQKGNMNTGSMLNFSTYLNWPAWFSFCGDEQLLNYSIGHLVLVMP